MPCTVAVGVTLICTGYRCWAELVRWKRPTPRARQTSPNPGSPLSQGKREAAVHLAF
jgi:hypothetical protein